MDCMQVNTMTSASMGPEPMKAQRDERQDLLSFVWMFGIVLFHAQSGCPTWFRELLSDFRVGGVVFFFALSGYHLVQRYDSTNWLVWYKGILSKRLRTLGLPYIIWCAVGLTGLDVLRQFGITSHAPTANAPLWYVKYLMLFCVGSIALIPIVSWIATKRWFCFAFLGSFAILPWMPLPMKFSLFLSLLGFSLGIGLAFRNGVKAPWRFLYPLCLAWICLYIIRLADLSPCLEWPLKAYSASILITISWLLVMHLRTVLHLPGFFRMTFFVYCSHGLLLRWMRAVGWPNGVFETLGGGVVAMGVSLLIAAILRKLVPSAYGVLSGGR